MKTLIDPNGRIAQFEDKEFPVHEDWQWVDAPPEVKVGWTYDGTFHAPAPFVPTLPENTPLTMRDMERILTTHLGITSQQIADAKRNR